MNPSDTIIQLVVAQGVGDTERLNVHRGILCKSSKFFQNSMKPEWINLKAGPNTIDLPDDPVDTVSDYVKWLYHDKIPIRLHLEATKDARKERAEEAEKIFVTLAKAYVFGEKIIDVRYKNAVLQTIVTAQKAFNWHMGSESARIVYEGTPPTSLLRRLVAENIAYNAHDDSAKGIGWMQWLSDCPREVLIDALKATLRVRQPIYDSKGPIPSVKSYLEKE